MESVKLIPLSHGLVYPTKTSYKWAAPLGHPANELHLVGHFKCGDAIA